jgi:hypothetical protein
MAKFYDGTKEEAGLLQYSSDMSLEGISQWNIKM